MSWYGSDFFLSRLPNGAMHHIYTHQHELVIYTSCDVQAVNRITHRVIYKLCTVYCQTVWLPPPRCAPIAVCCPPGRRQTLHPSDKAQPNPKPTDGWFIDLDLPGYCGNIDFYYSGSAVFSNNVSFLADYCSFWSGRFPWIEIGRTKNADICRNINFFIFFNIFSYPKP